MFIKSKSLTKFAVSPVSRYEFLNVGIDYSDGTLFDNTELTDEDDSIYYSLTGMNLLHEEDGQITYSDVAKILKIKQSELSKTVNAAHKTKYDPLENAPNLFIDISKIKYFDNKSLINFVKRYGLPSGLDSFEDDTNNVLIQYINLFDFNKELRRYKQCFEVFECLYSDDEQRIKKCLDDYKTFAYDIEKAVNNNISGSLINLNKINNEMVKVNGKFNHEAFLKQYNSLLNSKAAELNFQTSTMQKYISLVNSSSKTQLTQYLLELLNKVDKGNSTLTMENEKITQGYIFNDLFEVAYYQLSRALIDNVELKECINCGCLFESLHGSQKFCPPFPNNKYSTCQNTYNQRMKRKKKTKLNT